ncbi:MAG: O-antigen ligase family protein [bacterium]
MHVKGTAAQIGWWTAVGALFLLPFVPLLVTNSLYFPFITGKAFAFRILVEIALAGWAVLAFADKRYRPRFSWLGALFAVFVLWMFLADCFAINPEKALWSNFERMEGWITLVHLLGLFVVASSVLSAKDLWRRLWLTSLGVSVIVCLHGVLQLLGVAAIHQGSGRLDASLGNATYLAVYLLFHICIAAWLLRGEIERRSWLRYALPLLILFETYILFKTETRGAVLGVVIGAAVAGLLAALLSGGKTRRYGAGAVIAVLVLCGGFFLVRDSSFVTNNSALARIASISIDQGSTRFALWHMAYEGFLVHPVLGWGQEGYNYVFSEFYRPSLYDQEAWFDRAHNSFVDWLVAGGLPAFLLYISLFIAAFWLLLRRPEFTIAEKVGLSSLLVAYGVHSMFVFDNLISSLLFVLVIAYIHGKSARPVPYLERLPEVADESASTMVLPVAAVLLLAVLWFVNVPGIRAGSQLIEAITPSAQGPAGQLASFRDLLTHPAFASQEINEQLVSFSVSAISSESTGQEDKAAIASFAIAKMGELVERLPLDPRLRLEYALAYRVAGDSQNALKQDEAAEALSPRKQGIYIEEGNTLWEAGDMAGAKEAYEKAYALDPSFSDLAVYAAVGSVITGDSVAADAILQDAFGTTSVANEKLILAYYRFQDWPRLIRSLAQNVIDQNGAANAWFRLAAGYVNARDLSSARKAVQEGIAAHPEAAAQGRDLLLQIDAMAAQGQ